MWVSPCSYIGENAMKKKPTIERVIQAMLGMQRQCWEQGVAAQALYEAGETDLMISLATESVNRQSEDGRLSVIGENVAVNDPAASGEPVQRAFELTGDTRFETAADKMLEYLMMYAPRTEDGVLFHNTRSFHKGFTEKQLWVDGCYMTPPFLALRGEMTEATKQFGGYYNYLHDDETGLFYHIYDIGTNCFVRKKLWATGNGWVLLGTARLIDEAVRQNEVGVAGDFVEAGKDLLGAMLRFQNDDGMFHDILDNPKTFADGASAMMAAAFIYRGIAGSWLDEKYVENANRIYDTMTSKVDNYGIMRGVCGSPDFLTEGTSCEAQAFYVMMHAARERLLRAI